jgi:hypothetical protein
MAYFQTMVMFFSVFTAISDFGRGAFLQGLNLKDT